MPTMNHRTHAARLLRVRPRVFTKLAADPSRANRFPAPDNAKSGERANFCQIRKRPMGRIGYIYLH